MAEDRTRRRRRRWLVLAVLVGTGVWVVRSRRAAPAHLDEPRPVPRTAAPAGHAVAPAREDVPPPEPVPAGGSEPDEAPQALLTPATTAVPAPDEAPEALLTPATTAVPVPDAPPARPSPRPRRPAPQKRLPPGAAASLADGAAPGPEFTIKGNAESKLFHPPASPYFARTKAEFWFRSAEDARAAGFTEWTPKRRATG